MLIAKRGETLIMELIQKSLERVSDRNSPARRHAAGPAAGSPVLHGSAIAGAGLLMLLALCDAAPGFSLQIAPDAGRIQIESALVLVPVLVSDARGRFIPVLSPGSFTLYQDGAPTPFSLFLTSDDPLRIALLLDTSRSAATILGKIKKAAQQFLLQLRPQDLAMVIGFDSEIRMLCPLSSDRKELEEGIRSAKIGGSRTRMRDAIVDVAERRFQTVSGRTAIVLLTDGQDHGSRVSATDLHDAVAASGTPIYSIFYTVDPRELMRELFGVSSRLPRSGTGRARGGEGSWEEDEERAALHLQQISDLSAGRFFRSTSGDFDGIFKRIAEELRSQYLLGFYPDKSKLDGVMHSLEVRVGLPGAMVRSRRSYRAAKP